MDGAVMEGIGMKNVKVAQLILINYLVKLDLDVIFVIMIYVKIVLILPLIIS
jgi:hypothetical protein